MRWLCRFGLHRWIGDTYSLIDTCARCGKTRRRRPSNDTPVNPGSLIWK